MKLFFISTKLIFELILFTIVVVLFSCHLHIKNSKSNNHKDLENFKRIVKKHWDYNYDRGYVIPNEVFWDLSGWMDKYSEELKKLDTTDVQKLFGKPRKKVKVENEYRYYYFKQKECIPFTNNKDCSYYSFHFKENGQCYIVVRAMKFSTHH